MALLCFGGSFNPIHNGHLVVARAVAEVGRFDGVLLIPSAQPPHKPDSADLAAPRERAALCQAVSNADPFFQVDTRELRRSGPSYTIDTAAEFIAEGWPAVNWMIGADQVQILPKWRRYDDLLKQVTFWIARRPGYVIDWDSLPASMRRLSQRGYSALVGNFGDPNSPAGENGAIDSVLGARGCGTTDR